MRRFLRRLATQPQEELRVSLAATVEVNDASWEHGDFVVEASCGKATVETAVSTNIAAISRGGNTQSFRIIWEPVELTCPLKLTADGRSIQAPLLRLELAESRGKTKRRRLGAASVDIVNYIMARSEAGPSTAVGAAGAAASAAAAAGSGAGSADGGGGSSAEVMIVPLVTEYKKVPSATLYVQLAFVHEVAETAAEAPLAKPKMLIVATSKRGTTDEILLQGFHNHDMAAHLSKKEKRKAAAAAPPDVSILYNVPREIERIAARTGFLAAMRFGRIAVLVYEATSYAQILEAVRQAKYDGPEFAVSTVLLCGRLEPAAEAAARALVPDLVVSSTLGALAQRLRGELALGATIDEHRARIGWTADLDAMVASRLSTLQSVCNGFPVAVSADAVAEYEADVGAWVMDDCRVWEEARSDRGSLTREQLLQSMADADADAALRRSEMMRLRIDVTGLKAELIDERANSAALEAALAAMTAERDRALGEIAGRDAKVAKQKELSGLAHKKNANLEVAMEEQRMRYEALEAENAALKERCVELSVRLADDAFKREAEFVRNRNGPS